MRLYLCVMARYVNIPTREALPSGKIRGTAYQIRRVHGSVFLVRCPPPRKSFSEAERASQRRFAEATRLAGLDMRCDDSRAYWEDHKGCYRRAYDAAKAYYMRQLAEEVAVEGCAKECERVLLDAGLRMFREEECEGREKILLERDGFVYTTKADSWSRLLLNLGFSLEQELVAD